MRARCEPRQKCRPQAEAYVAPAVAADIEAIRFGEAVVVVVGCAVADPDL